MPVIINQELIKNPMNWLVIGFFTVFWLFTFHMLLESHKPKHEAEFNNGPLPNGTKLPDAVPMGSVDFLDTEFAGVPTSYF
jgi:hypothetical protein